LRLSRHARNQIRLYRVTIGDVEAVVANPAGSNQDGKGSRRLVGLVAGRRLRVVIAADDPGFVITVHERRS